MPGEGPPFAADAPVGISAPVAKALAAKQAITDLGNMTPPPSAGLENRFDPKADAVDVLGAKMRQLDNAAI